MIIMLEKGTKAPNFEGKDENGNTVKLSDFAGQCRNSFAGGWDNYVI